MYLNIIDEVAAKILLASRDHRANTIPPPATLRNGTAVSMATSHTNIDVSAPQQLTRRSPLGDQLTSVTGLWPDLKYCKKILEPFNVDTKTKVLKCYKIILHFCPFLE